MTWMFCVTSDVDNRNRWEPPYNWLINPEFSAFTRLRAPWLRVDTRVTFIQNGVLFEAPYTARDLHNFWLCIIDGYADLRPCEVCLYIASDVWEDEFNTRLVVHSTQAMPLIRWSIFRGWAIFLTVLICKCLTIHTIIVALPKVGSLFFHLQQH